MTSTSQQFIASSNMKGASPLLVKQKAFQIYSTKAKKV